MKLIGQSSGGSYVVEMNRSDWEFMGRIAAVCQAEPVAPVGTARVREFSGAVVEPNIMRDASPAAQRPEVERSERKRIAAKKPAATPAAGKTKACKVCGKPFTPKTSAKTCSPDCAKENERRTKSKHKDREAGGKLGFRKCAKCGKEFKAKHAGQHFCSDFCRSGVDKAKRLEALKATATRMGLRQADPMAAVDQIARDVAREDGGM